VWHDLQPVCRSRAVCGDGVETSGKLGAAVKIHLKLIPASERDRAHEDSDRKDWDHDFGRNIAVILIDMSMSEMA
jgi:hypothetical protein